MLRVDDVAVYYIPVSAERTLSFGKSEVSRVDVVRVALHVSDTNDWSRVSGWADVPLNLGWAWPGEPLERSEGVAKAVITAIRTRLVGSHYVADPFLWHRTQLEPVLREVVAAQEVQVPELVTMMCAAPFDIAFHDLFGKISGAPTFACYGPNALCCDLGSHYSADPTVRPVLDGVYPADVLTESPAESIIAWHLVGLSDPIDELIDWVHKDGLTAVKVKLNGVDMVQAAERLLKVTAALRESTVTRISVDFNGTVSDADELEMFVAGLDRISPKVCMVEQPFASPGIPSVSDRLRTLARERGVVLSLDESILDPRDVVAAHTGGWTGVVVKTCKTQTRALLIAAVAERMKLQVVVQDLTNPMLALIAHLQLAAHLDRGWGVEVNAVQYYPSVSQPEAQVHPDAYRRSGGEVSTRSFTGNGLGYRIEEIKRTLPPRVA